MNSTALAGISADPGGPVPSVSALLFPDQAARYLLLSVSTLARMRISGNGPKFLRVSPQRVAYRISDLDRYLDGRTRTSTSQL
jgi:hypothetical protein